MSRIGAGCAPHLVTQRLPRPSTPSRSGHLFVSPTGARTCVSAGPKAKAATGAALELAEAYFCAPAIKVRPQAIHLQPTNAPMAPDDLAQALDHMSA